MRPSRFFTLCFLVALVTSAMQAQVTGVYPFGPFATPGLDTVNLGNLNVHLTIPIFSKSGRGGTNFFYGLEYDGLVWQPVTVSGVETWTPAPEWGWTDVSNALYGYVTYNYQLNSCTYYSGKIIVHGYSPDYYDYAYHDNHGNTHAIPYSFTTTCGQGGTPSGTATYSLTDNSGLTIYRNSNSFTVFTKHGAEMAVPVYQNSKYYSQQSGDGSSVYTDNNGNEISASSTGITDTMGMTALSYSGSAPNPVVYTYTDSNGNKQTVTVNYATYAVETAFGVPGISEYSNSSVPLVSSIAYSGDGTSYSFGYECTPGTSGSGCPVTGRIASVTLRTGGTINYKYTGGYNGIESDGTTAGLIRTTSDGATTYTRSGVSSTASTTTVTDAVGNQTVDSFLINPTGYFYESDQQTYAGSASGTPVAEIQTCYNAAVCSSSSVSSAFTAISIYTYKNGTLVNLATKDYQGPELLQSDQESGTNTNNVTSYNYTQYSGQNGIAFYRLTSVVAATAGSGSQNYAETTYGYDETTPTATSGLPQHVAVSTPRGNLTSVHQWYNSTGSTLNTTMAYDDAGQVVSRTDTNNGMTSFAYDTATDTLLKQVTLPSINGTRFSASYNFDPNTGLMLSVTDINNQTTSYSYDGMLRPSQISYPDNGKTTYGYTPSQTSEYDYQNASTYADKETLYDGYGRVSRFAVYNGQQASQDWYQVDTCYNSDGQIGFQSYAYQGTGFAQSKICSGAGDVYSYDALGRTLKVTHADNTFVSYAYNATATQVTDENGVSRIINMLDASRIAGVCEISSNSSMPGSGSPASCNMPIAGTGFLTTYSYNLPSREVTVTQGAQTREFETDWAGRPIMTQEPESGQTTWSYSYNSTGLQVTRTRPAANQQSGTTTSTYQSDALGRLVSVTYSDGTAPKYYEYDSGPTWGATLTNQKGRLAWYGNANGGGSIQGIIGYDPMGRINLMEQCDPSNCGTGNYAASYTYDWLGNLLTMGDGQGVTNTYTYTPADEVASITSSVNDPTHPSNLLSNVQDGPDGPLSWQLGNGLYGVRSYDSLGRNNGGWVCSGTTQPYCNGGGQTYGYTVAWSGTRATSVCDTVLNRCSSFGYDEFNRLTSQTVTSGAADNFTYVYDRWGNRWQQNVTSGSGPSPQLSFNTSTNQITNSGYTYDAAGNLMSDGSHNYTYDADGNVIAVDGGSTAKYTFNALNERVRADLGSSSEEFIFDPFGRHTSAHDVVHGWTWADWIYSGDSNTGVAVDTDSQTNFDHQDWEGTERAMTLYNGTVEGTYNSLPFGDGYSVSGSDIDPLHFAMLDHDSTSDTDHATFRQYGNTQGRWMSPDPYSGSYDLPDPQSMNRYSYALNSPLSYIDPWGADVTVCDTNNNCYTYTDNEWNAAMANGYGDGISIGADGTVYCGDSPCGSVGYSEGGSGGVEYLPIPGGSGGAVAPNNGTPQMPRTPQQCAEQALKKNAVALSFDAAGIGAGFLPGGDLVVAGAQATVSVASGINSAAHGDAAGATLGVLGLPASFAGASAKFFGVGAKAIPGIGTAISALGTLNDAYSTYQDYQACLAGH